ncbi:ABC-type antimicrobial peptide transport system, permease component [Mucilaginibacter lappiensis]|uniref:ABC-type antimicrobial peptide transport system permease subunit n=1 Tax=Mucilaginibacter lappiensis TaxID=354630 RepID=A0ABR6PHZ3_9SPHI|nr:ABC transporter permease [Mucilaginibacter lappiensis]MBB6109377.1 ABC-type antimicrobial peptide transport system permease subunit [Mucilaginibacter lappiensis]SIQ97920.1 ABC-type antimicrobial peptide transport system, permease component [Mucilaginibacter lappiensis]
MIKNYIKIAWRNLKRNKAYAFISVAGLALGITCGILIFTLITYHLSFDNFHKNSDRVYRLYTEWHDDGIGRSHGVPQPLGKTFRNDFTLAEKTARVISFHDNLITITQGNQVKKFKEDNGVAFTEPEYFDILNFPLLKGDKKTVLVKPGEAIVTEKIARKYFGDDNPIGKVIRVDNKVNFTVTGVLKDLPANTDRKQQVYVSYGNMDEYTGSKKREDNWGGVFSGSEVFTLLKPSTTMESANSAMALIVKKHYTGRDLQVWKFKLQPLSDIHFNSDLDGYADKKYLWALFFIGLFLIITACVNFVNLATAQALNRAKEIGVRKVLGSLPHQLFWQFIAETALITFVAVILAIGLSFIALPAINNLFESQMTFKLFQLSVFIMLISVLVVFLSGSYPGLVLARFQPILALKSKLSQKHVGGFSLRRILVVTQFSISQVLIIGAIIIVSQLHYSQTTDLGFNKDAVVLLPIPQQDKAKLSTLRNRINEVQGVEKSSYCYKAPAAQSNNSTDVNFNHRGEDEHWGINTKQGDENFLSTFGMKLVAGRNFFPADTTHEFLVNETFVKKLNLKPQDVIGKMLAIDGKTIKAPIVGVVKDFYNYSFHTEISAICIMPDYRSYSTLAVKINMRNAKTSLAAFEKIWNETFPEELYSYQFLDDSVGKFYEMDNIQLKLVEAFAGIAILIGCLGLYGLVSFMAVRKTKEIGVRKVLGADTMHILWLFGKEFTYLLLIAFVVAAPLAWWAMHNYLQDFKYRITIGPGIFLTSILSTFIIASITVGYRSVMAATANPVKSLRSE